MPAPSASSRSLSTEPFGVNLIFKAELPGRTDFCVETVFWRARCRLYDNGHCCALEKNAENNQLSPCQAILNALKQIRACSKGRKQGLWKACHVPNRHER